MTAVILFAEAILQALIAIRSSISMSLTGFDAVCMMNTSAPRTEASIETNVSPLENREMLRVSELSEELILPSNEHHLLAVGIRREHGAI